MATAMADRVTTVATDRVTVPVMAAMARPTAAATAPLMGLGSAPANSKVQSVMFSPCLGGSSFRGTPVPIDHSQ